VIDQVPSSTPARMVFETIFLSHITRALLGYLENTQAETYPGKNSKADVFQNGKRGNPRNRNWLPNKTFRKLREE